MKKNHKSKSNKQTSNNTETNNRQIPGSKIENSFNLSNERCDNDSEFVLVPNLIPEQQTQQQNVHSKSNNQLQLQLNPQLLQIKAITIPNSFEYKSYALITINRTTVESNTPNQVVYDNEIENAKKNFGDRIGITYCTPAMDLNKIVQVGMQML